MTLANALVENVALGPTVVLNEAGMRLVKPPVHPDLSLCTTRSYLILAALGEVVYDPEPRMLYRLHSGNALGLRGLAHSRERVTLLNAGRSPTCTTSSCRPGSF